MDPKICTTDNHPFLREQEPFRYPENATQEEIIQLLKKRIASEPVYWDLKHQIKVSQIISTHTHTHIGRTH